MNVKTVGCVMLALIPMKWQGFFAKTVGIIIKTLNTVVRIAIFSGTNLFVNNIIEE